MFTSENIVRIVLLAALGISSVIFINHHFNQNPLAVNDFTHRLLQITDGAYPLRILALGGSTTYGSNLDNIKKTYPYLLGAFPRNVDNLAIRATGADYSSQCLQSLIGDKTYDVILLEFSQNGVVGLELLLQRLRERFPDAIIIYIHLYSLYAQVRSEDSKSPEELGKDPNIRWYWNKRKNVVENSLVPHIKEKISLVEGYIYELPRFSPPMDGVHLFTWDWHHLSNSGHRFIAGGIRKILKDAIPKSDIQNARLSPWGDGDECTSWFHNGTIPFSYTNAVMNEFSPGKYALQFRLSGSLTVINHKPFAIPIFISFMAWESKYPMTRVVLNGKTTMIRPTNLNIPGHITRLEKVGIAEPGENLLKFYPWEGSELPFRLTSIVLCSFDEKHVVNPFEF